MSPRDPDEILATAQAKLDRYRAARRGPAPASKPFPPGLYRQMPEGWTPPRGAVAFQSEWDGLYYAYES